MNQEAVSFILAWDFLPACAKQQGFSHGQNNIIFILEWNKFLKRANRWGHQQQELLLLNQVGKWDVTPSHYLLPRLHINRAASCYKCIHNSCFRVFFTQAVISVRINLFSCIMGLVGLINVAKIKRQGLNIKEFSLFFDIKVKNSSGSATGAKMSTQPSPFNFFLTIYVWLWQIELELWLPWEYSLWHQSVFVITFI